MTNVQASPSQTPHMPAMIAYKGQGCMAVGILIQNRGLLQRSEQTHRAVDSLRLEVAD